MTSRTLIFLFILASLAPGGFSQNINQDNRLREILARDGQVTVTVPLTDKKLAGYLTRYVSILSVNDATIHISLSPVTAEWFLLQKYDYLISEKKNSRSIVSASDVEQAMSWDTYPTYLQYDSIMQSFKTLYPALCRLDTIGRSINGKLILAIKISGNAAIDEDEPGVFYSSTIHGDETGGFILMLRLIDYLLKNYPGNSQVKNLVDNLAIWINPLANPDGTYRSDNTVSSAVRYNANGFDLNRNFPDPVTPNTVKQKETLDMMNFLREHRFVLSANFHSGFEVVNCPWDRWLSKFHVDDTWFYAISRAYADTVHQYSGPAYMNELDNGVTRGAAWYVINGGRQDFVTSELQGREVTVELDNQYITPSAQLSLLWQNNWRSLVGYLENALYGIHGIVQNAVTMTPVPAKVFIIGHDRDSSHVYSDTLSGRFVRLLAPGSWNLTFSAKGYRDTTISNIIVLARQRTGLIVNMVPVISNIDSTHPATPVIFPNPASENLKVMLPDVITGSVNVRIYNQTGLLISDYNTEQEQGTQLQVDIRWLADGTYTIVFTNRITRVSSRGRFVVIK